MTTLLKHKKWKTTREKKNGDFLINLNPRFRRGNVQVPIDLAAFAVMFFEPFVCLFEVAACELL